VIHPAIEVLERGAIHGKGLVATRSIRRGEAVWQMDPDTPLVPCSEVAAWPAARREAFSFVAFQCSETHLAVCEDISRYMNHSCAPNTWWADSCTLVAQRDIEPGEEVTYDYATSEIAIEFEMRCTCGSASCRGLVTNRDHLRPDWQEKYGDHLPDHVLWAIRRARGQP
jgi:SET domain-containing protein